MNQNPKIIRVVPYNMKQLANLYGMGYKTFRKWLKPHEAAIGVRAGYYYNFHQVAIIFQKLGLPKNYVLSEEDEILPPET